MKRCATCKCACKPLKNRGALESQVRTTGNIGNVGTALLKAVTK